MSISLSFRWLTKVLLISLIWWYVLVICPIIFRLQFFTSFPLALTHGNRVVVWRHESMKLLSGSTLRIARVQWLAWKDISMCRSQNMPHRPWLSMIIYAYLWITSGMLFREPPNSSCFYEAKRSWRKPTKIQPFGLGVSPVHWDVPKLRGIQRISRTIWDTWIPFGFWAFKAAAKHFRHFRCELKFENVELNFQTFWKSWILFSVVSFKGWLGGSPILYCA